MMTSTSKISQKDVREVVGAINTLTTEKAKELFFHMNVELNILDDIDNNYSGNMRKIRYVQAWYDGETDANWDKIVVGLKQVGMNSLAESLVKQKIPTSSGGPTSSLPSPPVTLPKEDELDLNNLSVNPSTSSPSSTPPPSPPLPDRIAEVKAGIENLGEIFFNIVADAQTEMLLKESVDPSFLQKVVDRLLALPVAQKAPHVKFFRDSEDDLLSANSIRKLIAILKRYCNWSNYEIMGVVVRKFCEAELQHRMQEYCESLETFERGTTVDIYLEAISAGPVLSSEFKKMVVTLNKPANQCTLYEVRKLKETIAERASLQPYSVYIGDISVGSVKLELGFPASCVGWILGVMIPDFLASHQIFEVVLDQNMLVIIEERPIEELNSELTKACKLGDVVRVASLLNSGAHVQCVDKVYFGYSPLIWASLRGYLQVIRLLVTRGAHINYTSKFGATSLAISVIDGKIDTVRELISLGADLNVQSNNGNTALISAIAEGELQIPMELVKAGCNLNLKNKDGVTALMIAVRSGKSKLIKLLLDEEEIDLDIQENKRGWTALHLSAENGDSATTHALIRAGANVHIKAKNGWTAQEIAEVKAVNKDAQLISELNRYPRSSYKGKRDYETVVGLLRGNIETLPSSIEAIEACKEESISVLKEDVEREVLLKREWMRQRSQGRGIVEMVGPPEEEPHDSFSSLRSHDSSFRDLY